MWESALRSPEVRRQGCRGRQELGQRRLELEERVADSGQWETSQVGRTRVPVIDTKVHSAQGP